MNTNATDTKQETPERVLARERRRALMQELVALDNYLGLEPKVVALCPDCKKRWNAKRAA